MTKLLLSTAAIALLGFTPLASTPSNAQLSVISVQELAQLQQILGQMQSVLNVNSEIFDTAQDQLGAVTGNFGAGRGILQQLSQLRRSVQNGSLIFSQLPLDGVVRLDDLDFTNPEDIVTVLGERFDRNVGLEARKVLVKSQNQTRAQATHEAIVDSERIINSVNENLDELSSLANQVDQTQTGKEAQDLANRLLLEILTVQQQQLQLLARLARAEQLQSFDGLKAEENALESENPDTRSRVLRDFEEGGLDLQFPNVEVDKQFENRTKSLLRGGKF